MTQEDNNRINPRRRQSVIGDDLRKLLIQKVVFDGCTVSKAARDLQINKSTAKPNSKNI